MEYNKQSVGIPPHTKKASSQFDSKLRNISGSSIEKNQITTIKLDEKLPHHRQENVYEVGKEEEPNPNEESDYSGTSDSESEEVEGYLITKK